MESEKVVEPTTVTVVEETVVVEEPSKEPVTVSNVTVVVEEPVAAAEVSKEVGEHAVTEEPEKDETNGVSEKNGTKDEEKNGSKDEEVPKENGETNGISKENEDGDLKRKSGVVEDTPAAEVSAEKKAKLAEDAAEPIPEVAGVEAN